MADDITLPGTGGVVATDKDEGTGKHYQWLKPAWGPDDTYNKVDQAAGKRLPVACVFTVSTYGTRSIANTATVIPSTAQTGRQKIVIRNVGGTTVYLGWDSSVTTSNGMPLGPNEVFVEYCDHAVYGIVASGTCEVRYTEHK